MIKMIFRERTTVIFGNYKHVLHTLDYTNAIMDHPTFIVSTQKEGSIRTQNIENICCCILDISNEYTQLKDVSHTCIQAILADQHQRHPIMLFTDVFVTLSMEFWAFGYSKCSIMSILIQNIRKTSQSR